MAPKTTVLVNARIRTMDDALPEAEAVSFSAGRILQVGDGNKLLRAAGPNLQIFDAGGRTVLPGFIDCHTHFLSLGVWSNRLDLFETRKLSDVLDAVKKRADSRKTRGSWILGRGWDEAKWPEGRYLTRRDLDAVSPNNPVMLIRVCGHLATLNSRGLEALRKVIGKKDVDSSTGIITERALELARRRLRPSMDEMAAGLEYSLDLARRLGVTSVHDIIDVDKLRAYEAARKGRRLTVRACLHFEQADYLELLRSGSRTGLGGPILRLGGMKLYADGSFGARTAALDEPYADAPKERGELLHSTAHLRSAIRNAEKGGFQLLIHAIGDRAASQVVSAFSSTLGTPTVLRHRIEHLELPKKAELAGLRRLGIFASMQPNFVGEWGRPGGMMEARLGKRRYQHADPFKAVLKARVRLVFGSDCMPFNPLWGIHSAVNAPFPDQRLTVEEAVAAYTRTAAFASFEEDFKGTISPKKAADMVVLSKDPFKDPASIKDIRVNATIFDGRIVWKSAR
jgi:hypothetical protein